MERTLEFEAILEDSWGTVTSKNHFDKHHVFGREAPIKANEKGELLAGEGTKIIVKEVTYKATRNQPSVHFYDEEHQFTFKEYVQMGRPNVIKVKKTFEYSSLAKMVPSSS